MHDPRRGQRVARPEAREPLPRHAGSLRAAIQPLPPHSPGLVVKARERQVIAGDPVVRVVSAYRYLRIETDAESKYHDLANPQASRVNLIITGVGLSIAGTTPLKGGRMRAIVRCDSKAKIKGTGTIRVELTRVGLPALADSRPFVIVAPPPAQPAKKAVSVPRIDPRPIDPSHEQWNILNWPLDDLTYAASDSEMEGGTLVVWYSTVYPSYAREFKAFEQKDPALAKSFNTRYAIWLAVHSLLLQQERDDAASNPPGGQPIPDEAAEQVERLERCRIARMCSMVAVREVKEMKGTSVEGD